MTIFWATKARAYLQYLSNPLMIFVPNKSGFYQTNGRIRRIITVILRSKAMDYFGIFKINKTKNVNCDYYASYNRFLKCDKPYFIYLENPTALYHYAINRIKYPIGKRRFNKSINNENLKGIIFMSSICKKTFNSMNGKIPDNIKTETIYPLVPNNKHINEDKIKKKSNRKKLEILYIAQGKRFISKGGLEVLDSIERCDNVHLTIITEISSINNQIINRINNNKKISLLNFNLKYHELEKVYAKANILLHPSSDDSFPLTVIEAIKGGCAIIASRLYAIPEVVEDGKNGILIEPKYWFFNQNGIPNPEIWNHRKKTIYSIKTSEVLINDIINKVNYLNKNRDVLQMYCLESYRKSIDDSILGENGLRKKWINFINAIQ